MLHSVSAEWMRRPLIKGFESPLICPSGSLDFVLDDAAGIIWPGDNLLHLFEDFALDTGRRQCPLWVTSGHMRRNKRCLLYTQ
jgi:hypothetical protein